MAPKYSIQIEVVDGIPIPELYSARLKKSEKDTVEWNSEHQFYLKFEDRSPFDPNDPLIQSTQSTPGHWMSGPWLVQAEPDRYPYGATVMWANPRRPDGAIEPIHHNSPDIIVEL